MVDFTLEKEFERSKALAESPAEENIIEMDTHIIPDAASARTDINVPEGTDTSEDDIMDDKDF